MVRTPQTMATRSRVADAAGENFFKYRAARWLKVIMNMKKMSKNDHQTDLIPKVKMMMTMTSTSALQAAVLLFNILLISILIFDKNNVTESWRVFQ